MSSLGSTCDLTVEEKRKAVDQVLGSRTFARSGRIQNLLRFLCEAEIEGRAATLNEYTIGVEALGRPEGYSPIEDSSVRSRVYELRQKLERFYAEVAPDADIRIVVPKGSHVPQFYRNEVPSPQPANLVSFSGADPSPWRRTWTMGGMFLGGALLMYLLLATWPSRLPSPRSAPSPEMWTPALEAIWQPLLDPKTPVLVSYEPRLLVTVGPISVRDRRLNHLEQVASSKPIMEIKRLFGVPQVYENFKFTDFGAVHAAFLVARQLASRKADIWLKRSVDVTAEDIRSNHVVFLGRPSTDPGIRRTLARGELIDEGGLVRIVHPKPGESSEYHDQREELAPEKWAEKYAVISLLPGRAPGKRILSLAAGGSEHPWGVAQYLTTPRHAREMFEHLRLPSGPLPECYQVLIKVRFKNQVPIDVLYVTHRILDAGRFRD